MERKNGIFMIENFKLDNYHLLLNETLFHNANGYIGVRSVFEEGYPEGYQSIRGQYINGFYDFSKLRQAEKLFGLVEEKQAMLNVVDTQSIKLFIDDEEFSMFTGTVLESNRWVDMNKGVTVRSVSWRSPKGKEIKITITRMTSFHQLSLFTIDYEVVPLNFSAEIIIESNHDGEVFNYGDCNDPRNAEEDIRYLGTSSCEIKDGASYITSITSQSGLIVCSGVKDVFSQKSERQFIIDHNNAICKLTTLGQQGEKIRLIKYAVFSDSIRYENPREQAAIEMEKATHTSLEDLYKKQEEYLADYFQNCYVSIETDDEETNVAMRYNLFQLIQSVGKDQYCNISPKGLSGEGYEGHYFWDTEMYIQPCFTITYPKVSKNLIEYRYTILDKAKENAKILGHKKGALYPWRTIMGKECSGYFPAGTAQYHINGDIAYSIIAYYLATKDMDFIYQKGAEIIFETARLWIDVGNFHEGKFHINDVTGPDEYTCIVNNNYYTNVIAKYHLNWAAKFYNMLKSSGKITKLAEKLELKNEEIEEFKIAANLMYLPYDEKLKINPQDDSFLQKSIWDEDVILNDKSPLLLHYHPLHLYRHQICKQPDTVMAHFILEDAQSEEIIRNSYEYYEKITTHDSSLSKCVFSIMAAKLGMIEKAYEYFGNAIKLDLLDLHRNAKDGIHAANMGGNYMAIVYGFGGLRLKESGISFSPVLPKNWNGYRFKVSYEDSRIMIHITVEECIFLLEYGEPKEITVYGKKYLLEETLTIIRE